MDSLPLSLEPRPFQGLLSGLIKKNFYGDKDITVEFLVEELYSTIEESEQGQHQSEIALYEKILLKAAEQNWEVSRLSDFLTQRLLPADHVQVFTNIWSKEAGKINKKILQDATWNDSLDRLTWRVDVRALSKTTTEHSDEPIAFFELATKRSVNQSTALNQKYGSTRNAKFEMNREEVGNMLASLNEIDQVFEGVR